MIFPNLRSPSEKAIPATNLKRLAKLAYHYIVSARYPDQKTESQHAPEGSQAAQSASRPVVP
jgi:hypothetical protein